MLKMGLLWFDDDKYRSTDQKMSEAAYRYLERFGVAPNVCYVHTQTQAESPYLRIVPSPTINRNYFLVGVDEDVPTIDLAPLPPLATTLQHPIDMTVLRPRRAAATSRRGA